MASTEHWTRNFRRVGLESGSGESTDSFGARSALGRSVVVRLLIEAKFFTRLTASNFNLPISSTCGRQLLSSRCAGQQVIPQILAGIGGYLADSKRLNTAS